MFIPSVGNTLLVSQRTDSGAVAFSGVCVSEPVVGVGVVFAFFSITAQQPFHGPNTRLGLFLYIHGENL